MFAIVLVAFSLGEVPRGASTQLSAQAFDGGQAARAAERLKTIGGPRRGPGSDGDDRMAARVRRDFARLGFAASSRPVSVRTLSGRRTVPLVVGRRTGLADGVVTVVADRSSLAATGGLLELARVFGGRGPTKTLQLVSTASGPGGSGTKPLTSSLPRAPGVVVVLGPLGTPGSRTPWVVPWSTRASAAPIALRRTVERAMAAEVRRSPGAEGGFVQFARLAFPLTLGAQGPLLEDGVPAVLVGPHGERPLGDSEVVDAGQLTLFGRGVLRAVTALDAGGAPGSGTRDLVVARHVLPSWTVRLLAAIGILPVLLVMIDGLARLSRRKDHPLAGIRWALVVAAPLLVAALLPRLLGALGILDSGPVLPGDAGGVTRPEVAALVLCVAVAVGGWIGVRPGLARLAGADTAPASARAAGALTLALVAAVLLWVVNPFAAALLVPALHLWILAAVPDLRPDRRAAVSLAVLGLVPPLIVLLIYAFAFDLGPVGLVRNALLGLAGGAVGLGETVLWTLAAAAFACVLLLAREGRRPLNPPAESSVRGPLSYAGPGSLGGTRSAIRR
jgi:hypothetical protein